MRLSLQRLGDNPRDHDELSFERPINEDACDVSGLRSDSAEGEWFSSPSSSIPSSSSVKGKEPSTKTLGKGEEEREKKTRHGHGPWKMQPPPPPPHWHPNVSPDRPGATLESRRFVGGNEEFDYASIEIPGEGEEGMGMGWWYAMDDRGVFQVYGAETSGMCIFAIFHFFLQSTADT